MGHKYSSVEGDIFSIFGTVGWKAEAIKTIPNNFSTSNLGNEFIRVDIIPSGSLNSASCSGLIMIDIFTEAGKGMKRTAEIADKLDTYLLGKTLMTTSYGTTQCISSSLGRGNPDPDNKSLFRSTYSITFTYYGVT